MDKTPITNFTLRRSSSKSTGMQSDKGSQDVKPPFQFLTGNTSTSKSEGFHFAAPIFLRSNFSVSGNSNTHENTPMRGVNAERHYSPFSFSGLRAGGNPISTDKAEEKTTAQSMVPQSSAKVIQGTHKLAHDCSASWDSTTELNQGFITPKEESGETSLTCTSDHEEDLLLTITAKYRQAQREMSKQREVNADLEAQLTKKNEENTALSASFASQKQILLKLKEKHGFFPIRYAHRLKSLEQLFRFEDRTRKFEGCFDFVYRVPG